MKFTIFFLLGLCAVAANASWEEISEFNVEYIENRNSVTDTIKEKIEGFINVITKQFGVVASKIKAIIQDVNDQAGSLVMKAKDKANGIKSEIQGKLKEMKQKGGEVAECAKRLEPDYWKVEKDAMDEVKKCAGEVYVASEEMREDVSRGMSGISNSIRDFRDLVADCLGWNPISSVKCVKEKVDEFKKVFNELLSNISDALRAAQNKSVEIIKSAHECNARALSKAKARVNDLNQALAKCYKFDDDSYYY